MQKLNIYPQQINAIFINKSISHAEKEVLIRKALIDYPENEAGILHVLVLTLGILEKTAECIDVIERIIPLLDDKGEIGMLYFNEGMKYLVLENKDKALEKFTKAFEINKVREAGMELVRIYKDRLDWNNAIIALNSIDCYENDHKLDKYIQMGIVYSNNKDYENAIVYYKKYLEINPNHLGVLGNLRIIYGELERYDDCIKILVKSLKVDPKNAVTYFDLGNMYCEKEDYHMSKHYFLEAIKLKPDYTSAYINLGSLTFLDLGDAEKGLEYLLIAMELNIEDNVILKVLYKNLINVYTKLENIEKVEYYKLKLANLEGGETK